MRITRKQAESLVLLWCNIYKFHHNRTKGGGGISYLQFRRGISPLVGDDSAFCVQWCGMWVCIEPDGYCHT